MTTNVSVDLQDIRARRYLQQIFAGSPTLSEGLWRGLPTFLYIHAHGRCGPQRRGLLIWVTRVTHYSGMNRQTNFSDACDTT